MTEATFNDTIIAWFGFASDTFNAMFPKFGDKILPTFTNLQDIKAFALQDLEVSSSASGEETFTREALMEELFLFTRYQKLYFH